MDDRSILLISAILLIKGCMIHMYGVLNLGSITGVS